MFIPNDFVAVALNCFCVLWSWLKIHVYRTYRSKRINIYLRVGVMYNKYKLMGDFAKTKVYFFEIGQNFSGCGNVTWDLPRMTYDFFNLVSLCITCIHATLTYKIPRYVWYVRFKYNTFLIHETILKRDWYLFYTYAIKVEVFIK